MLVVDERVVLDLAGAGVVNLVLHGGRSFILELVGGGVTALRGGHGFQAGHVGHARWYGLQDD